jgi:hypothetical protein
MDHETTELIKALAWPVAVIITSIFVYIIVKRGGVSSMTAGKDGISLQLVETRQEREYYMNRRIAEIDQDLRAAIMAKTRDLKRPILRAVSGSTLCSAALRAIAADLRAPMYQAVDDNDFKHRLAKANRDKYIETKLYELQEEYKDLTEESESDPCAAGPAAIIFYPQWEEVEPKLRRAVETWVLWIRVAVIEACQKKITVYEEYRPGFAAAKDKKFMEIVDSCIAKNKGYIQELEIA